MQLIQRRIDCSVDQLLLTTPKGALGHRISFKASKNWKPEPNDCEIKIYNLSPEQRALLAQTKEPLVKLAAGYSDDTNALTQLFYGNAIHSWSEVDSQAGDILTTVSTTDGGTQKRRARINVSFDRGTSTGTVLRRIVKELGLSAGNVDKIAREIDAGLHANIYLEGTTISGSAADELAHVCRSCGYEYSIQDGAVQILKFGQALDNFAVRLDVTSGLVGSPTISNKGVVTGTCLLFKAGAGLDLLPGRLINLKSRFVSGQFILGKVDFSGDNWADDWYCNFEAVTKRDQLVEIK